MRLKPGRERSLQRLHPWIFASAIADVMGETAPGQTVAVKNKNGTFLAWGSYSPTSQIRVRIGSWKKDEPFDQELIFQRIKKAVQARTSMEGLLDTNAVRLVNAESDGIPGLVVDRYDDILVTQFASVGSQFWSQEIVPALVDAAGCEKVFNRSDVDVRKLEGLLPETGWLRGGSTAESVRIEENSLKYQVAFTRGQKTGFFLDQRRSRRIMRNYARSREVLDCFSYTGGFSLNCYQGGAARITSVDSSSDALRILEENIALNGFDPGRFDLLQGDVFTTLREFRDRGRKFDLIVMDPPKFAPTSAQAERAARGYKDINLLALKLLNPGGLLATFSCSGGISAELFQKIVASSAVDAGLEAQIIEYFHQDVDHPVSIHFPEGTYLKGLLLRVE